jgi:hypothetical protein
MIGERRFNSRILIQAGCASFFVGSLPPPMNLPGQNACLLMASYRQVHAGEGRGGGQNDAWLSPSP